MNTERLQNVQNLVNAAKSIETIVADLKAMMIKFRSDIDLETASFKSAVEMLEKEGISVDQCLTLIEILDPDSLSVVKKAITLSMSDKLPQQREIIQTPTIISDVVEEDSKPMQEQDEPKKKSIYKKRIIVSDYGEVIVTSEGHVIVNGKQCDEFLNTSGYQYVALPTKDGKFKKLLLHKLVAQAFLSKPKKSGDRIVHKNLNPTDCRPSNLGWSSETPVKNTEFDETIAIAICEELVRTNMDKANALRALIEERKIYTTRAYIDKVVNKEVFAHISDKYFDEKGKPLPKNTKEKEDFIKTVLNKNGRSLKKTWDIVKTSPLKITLYDVFNIKYGEVGKPVMEDIYAMIRYVRNMNVDNIEDTLFNECALQVTHQQIVAATRER